MKRAHVAGTRALMSAALAAAAMVVASGVHAQTIIEEWSTVQAPQPPALKAVKVDPRTTALLVLDIIKQGCNAERRPRCIASLPKIAKLLADAHSHNMTVVYSTFPPGKREDILPEVAPKGGEPMVTTFAEKFINTDLEKILKDKGITTVIIAGTAAHGAVLYTSSGAVLRGFQAIVPMEGLSAENTFAELAAVWMLANAPTIAGKVTLTKLDMISY